LNRCSRCLIPNTRPDTAFVNGVCSACISFDRRKAVDWAAREQELIRILEQCRRPGAAYDCIVASSGGKDSTWQTLKLLELGVRPLVVTATTCHLTEIGRRNIDNLARYATTIEVSPNKSVRYRLNRLGLELVGDISWPEHVSIFTTPFRVAVQLHTPLVFYGENPQEAYGGPQGTEQAREMTRRWVSEFGGFLGLRPRDLIGQEGITERDMADYMPPTAAELDKAGVVVYWLGQFYEWGSHRNAHEATKAGFTYQRPTKANWWAWENQDNAQTGLHDHAMFRKYGYGRGCAQISVDIRAGKIGRGVALDWVRHHDGLFPDAYMGVPVQEVIGRIGVSEEKLHATLDRFTDWSIFRRVIDDYRAPPVLLGPACSPGV